MPACSNGARPKPGFEDQEFWLDRLALNSAVALVLRTFALPAWTSITAQLVSTPGVCASNPSPPTAISVEDIIRQTASTVTGSAIGDPVLLQKAYDWLRYQHFLEFCECIPFESEPGFDCVPPQPPLSLPNLGSIVGPFPVTVSSEVLASRIIHPNGDWTWSFSGSALVSGAATTGNDLVVQYQAVDGSWIDGPDLQFLNTTAATCFTATYQANVPKFGSSTAFRIVNRAGGAYTVTDFDFCLCVPVTTPPPLPVQPPLTDTPVPPALACTSEDLCAMVTELSHRLTTIAAQISDLQASVIGNDVLQVLDEMDMPVEGQRTLVLGTRAVSVELTELGDEAFTSALGNPRGLMRVGSIRWYDGIGYSPRRFIDADRFDDVRPAGALAISWQLLPGTTGILKLLG